MEHLIVLAVQCIISLFVFYTLIRWYIHPRLSKQNFSDILSFLLIINVFRYLPLSLFMPGQVSELFPQYLKGVVAYGDLASAMLALVSLFLVRRESPLARPMVWLFSMVSVLDMVIVLSLAMSEKVYQLDLGANYFTVSVYVPMLMVIQWTILQMLTSKTLR